jgi:hypothetical protein
MYFLFKSQILSIEDEFETIFNILASQASGTTKTKFPSELT